MQISTFETAVSASKADPVAGNVLYFLMAIGLFVLVALVWKRIRKSERRRRAWELAAGACFLVLFGLAALGVAFDGFFGKQVGQWFFLSEVLPAIAIPVCFVVSLFFAPEDAEVPHGRWWSEVWSEQVRKFRVGRAKVQKVGAVLAKPRARIPSGEWYTRTVGRILIAGVLLGVASAALMLTSLLGNGGIPVVARQVAFQWGSIYMVSFAIPLFTTWAMLAFITGKARVRESLRRVAEPSAYGTAAGLLVGCLSVLLSPFATAVGSPPVYSSDVLLGCAAMGGSIGFVIGGFLVVVDAANRFRNPLFGWPVAVVIGTVAAAVWGKVAASPRKVGSVWANSITADLPPMPPELLAASVPDVSKYPDSWKYAVAQPSFLEVLIPGGWFAVLVGCLLLVCFICLGVSRWASSRRSATSTEHERQLRSEVNFLGKYAGDS